jgi:hypothetical protein
MGQMIVPKRADQRLQVSAARDTVSVLRAASSNYLLGIIQLHPFDPWTSAALCRQSQGERPLLVWTQFRNSSDAGLSPTRLGQVRPLAPALVVAGECLLINHQISGCSTSCAEIWPRGEFIGMRRIPIQSASGSDLCRGDGTGLHCIALQ